MPPGSSVSPQNGRGALTRRRLLQAGGGVAALGVAGAALKLPFFGASGAQQDPLGCRAGDLSASEKEGIPSVAGTNASPRRRRMVVCSSEGSTGALMQVPLAGLRF